RQRAHHRQRAARRNKEFYNEENQAQDEQQNGPREWCHGGKLKEPKIQRTESKLLLFWFFGSLVLRFFLLGVDPSYYHAAARDFFHRDRRSLGNQLAVADAIDQLITKLHFARRH